jgi:hypothetical protein
LVELPRFPTVPPFFDAFFFTEVFFTEVFFLGAVFLPGFAGLAGAPRRPGVPPGFETLGAINMLLFW